MTQVNVWHNATMKPTATTTARLTQEHIAAVLRVYNSGAMVVVVVVAAVVVVGLVVVFAAVVVLVLLLTMYIIISSLVNTQ